MAIEVAPEFREDYIREFLCEMYQEVPTDRDVRQILEYMESEDMFVQKEYAIVDAVVMELYGFMRWQRRQTSNQFDKQHRARVRAGDGLDTEFRIG